MRFVSYTDRKTVAAALKPIYQASTADAALDALTRSPTRYRAAVPVGGQDVPGCVGAVHPVLAFPPELRRVIYTPTASNR